MVQSASSLRGYELVEQLDVKLGAPRAVIQLDPVSGHLTELELAQRDPTERELLQRVGR